MNRIRIALLAAVGLALFATVLAASSTRWAHSTKSSAPLRYMALPGGDVGEELGRMDTYWNDRVTYPTGNYNPAWLRHAAEQADKIPSGIPAGTAGSRWPTYSAPSRTLVALARHGVACFAVLGEPPSVRPPMRHVQVRPGVPVVDHQERNQPDGLT